MNKPPLHFTAREQLCRNPLAKLLFTLMDEKQTNLALSADVTTTAALLKLADQLGPEICVLKTHVDILDDFTPACIDTLTQLAQQHRFLLFEDRKFADIGNTVKHQYAGGLYHIATWAHMVTAHSLPGPDIIKGLAEVGVQYGRGLLLLAEMSSTQHLMDPTYIQQTIAFAEQYPEFVIGFITQHKLSSQPHWLYFTPGIKLQKGSDSLGQQYTTPEMAIIDQDCDIIIVGRGILQASDPVAAAKQYRQRGWEAYCQRLKYSKPLA